MKYLLDANAWIGHLRQTAPEVSRSVPIWLHSECQLGQTTC